MQCARGIYVQASSLRRACGRCFVAQVRTADPGWRCKIPKPPLSTGTIALQPILGRRISHRSRPATVKAVESETKVQACHCATLHWSIC